MDKPLYILLVDDERPQLSILKLCFENRGYRVLTAESGFEALNLYDTYKPPVVIADVRMPGMDGLELLRRLKEQDEITEVIMITAYGDLDVAVKALKQGAADFILKPLNLENLVQVVNNAVARSKILSVSIPRSPDDQADSAWQTILTNNTEMRKLIQRASLAAQSDASILIRGESGTGKELFAHAIQQSSPRARHPFVVVNCAALNENLLESELFGHCKGAFTGALQDRTGRFQEADSGTIFLDEIGDIPLGTQVKLLRVLQNGELQRVGENKTLQVNVRLIAATNQNLERMLAARSFREDLYYRLNVISLRIPPLRERTDDILFLADHFLALFAIVMKRPNPSLSSKAASILLRYSFPGNIRELENIIQRALVMTSSPLIQSLDIKDEYLPELELVSEVRQHETTQLNLTTLLESVERHAIENALKQTHNNLDAAAALLGISKRQLRYRKRKLDIT